jgi:hypothetical protein
MSMTEPAPKTIGRRSLLLLTVIGIATGVALAEWNDRFDPPTNAKGFHDGFRIQAGITEQRGVIFRRYADEPLSVLRIRLGTTRYRLWTAFLLPRDCPTSGDNPERLRTTCEAPYEGGKVKGVTSVASLRFLVVEFQVSLECYEAVTSGAGWPSGLPACAD